MPQKITIITIGKVKEPYLKQGIDEYKRRISRFADLDIIELKDEGLDKDSQKIRRYLGQNTFILDAKGKHLSSRRFASTIKEHPQKIVFVIGGADGLAQELKENYNTISLSKMTFIHEMCQLFLLEQIYRGIMINTNRKYHR